MTTRTQRQFSPDSIKAESVILVCSSGKIVAASQ